MNPPPSTAEVSPSQIRRTGITPPSRRGGSGRRLDDVIVFHPLNRDHIAQIVAILARDVQKRLGEEELTLRLTPAATDFLVDHGYDEHFGARPLKRAIQKYVEDPLSEKILVGDFAKGDEIEVDVAPDKERLAFRALSGSKA